MTEPNHRDSIYIDGQWVASSGTELIEVENPATEQVIGRCRRVRGDVDRAVAAARAAFDGWAATSPEERASTCPGCTTRWRRARRSR